MDGNIKKLIPSKIRRLIQLGLLAAEQADNATQVKRATTSYENAKKKSKVFAEREKLAQKNDFETVTKSESFPKNIITPEDLQGEILIPLMGDPSDIGLLSRVGGIPVNSQIEGGSKFPFKWKDLSWASEPKSAGSYVDKVRHIAEKQGQAPVSVNTLMTNESMYSPRFVIDSVLQQIENSPNILKKDILNFDKTIRKKFPKVEWPGLLNGGKEMLLSLPMRQRAAILKVMSQAQFRDKGFPLIDETIRGARDRRFDNSILGDSGAAIVRVDPNQDLVSLPDYIHKNYGSGMKKVSGSEAQQLERLIPFRTFFKDLFAEKAVLKDKNGRPLTVPNAIGAGNLSKDGFQKADQQWVDANMQYLERMKGNPKGLLSAVGAPTAGVLAKDYQGDPMTGMDMLQVKGAGVPFLPTMKEYGLSALRGAVQATLDSMKGASFVPGFKKVAETAERAKVPDYEAKYATDIDKTLFELLGSFIQPNLK